jgi:hypothetical protein
MPYKLKPLLAASLLFFQSHGAFAQCAASLGGDPPESEVVNCLKQLEKEIDTLKVAQKAAISLLAGGIVSDDGDQVSHFGPINFVPVRESQAVNSDRFGPYQGTSSVQSYHYRIKFTAPLPSAPPLILVGAIQPAGVVTPFVVESKTPGEFFVYVEDSLNRPNEVNSQHAYVSSAFWFLVLGGDQKK